MMKPAGPKYQKSPKDWDQADVDWDQEAHEADLEAAKERIKRKSCACGDIGITCNKTRGLKNAG